MSSNLETLYDILTVYHSRFEGVSGIIIQFGEYGMSIQGVWNVPPTDDHPEGGRIEITKFIPKVEMENLPDGAGEHLEKLSLDFIETLHMKWEVGED